VSGALPDIDPTAVFGPAPGVAWVAIADEIVVYRVAGAASLVLNATAGLLWQCLDGTSRLCDILDDLADAFVTDRMQLEKDCIPVASTWLAESLVEEVHGA
jgi:Coenzyme PQQ synthesis protein D (PqqD)